MTTEALIRDALADLCKEPEALDEIAADYGIKPEVLRARFERAYPNGAPTQINLQTKIDEAVAAACTKYGVPAHSASVLMTKDGRKVTVICGSYDGRGVVCVSHDTAATLVFGHGAFSVQSVRLAQARAA